MTRRVLATGFAWPSVCATGVAGVLVVALVQVASRGVAAALGACTFAAMVTLFVIIGRLRFAIGMFVLAFATAPMYKGLAPSVQAIVTPTDVFLALGCILLIPTILAKRVRLPQSYLAGILVLLVTGSVASLISSQSLVSFASFALWLAMIGVLPVIFAWWRPSWQVVELLLWAYVAGHTFSTVYGLVQGPYAQGRYAGLATHFNYFAEAGLMAIAMLAFLFSRYRTPRMLSLVALAAGIAVTSIYLSGSRGATLVLAVLVLMYPLVERSAIAGFFWGLVGASLILLFPYFAGFFGEGSSITRLSGNLSSEYSDVHRERGLSEGWARFGDHPFTGSGVVDLLWIHNTYLEAAVAVGIFGLVGYGLVLFTFVRPLFGSGPSRRICYVGVACVGWGNFAPALYDRAIWLPVALSIVAALAREPTIGLTKSNIVRQRPSVAAEPTDG